jgi:hypothetical protein
MAFGDIIQSKHGTAASGALTITLTTAATAGNLLLVVFARSTASTDGTPTGGWTPITASLGGNLDGSWFYKIAAGGETAVTSADGAQGNVTGNILEFEGPFAESPLDKIAEDESHVSTVTATQSSGTTAITSQDFELAIAFFAGDNGTNFALNRTLTNGFSLFSGDSTTARAYYAVGHKVLTSTGTQECTFSTTVGDEMYGAIATFMAQVIGQPTDIRGNTIPGMRSWQPRIGG